MKAEITDAGELILHEIDGLLGAMLLALPDVSLPRDYKPSHDRIYQMPCADVEEQANWKEYVEPEMRTQFSTASDLVAADLQSLATDECDSGSICIPPAHMDAWMNTLTRARLILFEDHQLSDEDMEQGVRSLENPRDLALMHVGIYGMLLEYLVQLQS